MKIKHLFVFCCSNCGEKLKLSTHIIEDFSPSETEVHNEEDIQADQNEQCQTQEIHDTKQEVSYFLTSFLVLFSGYRLKFPTSDT